MKVLGHRLQLLTGLLLHDVTMAGLQELRFPEEKPLLRGQDATEMDNPDAFLSIVDTDWKVGWGSASQIWDPYLSGLLSHWAGS